MISDIWEITMFGYINVLKDELKIKDYNVFRAFYCGLCKTQGEIFGNLSRISLSYDFTFLAILLSSLNGESCEYFTGKCMLHPLHKRSFAKCQKDLEYCSYMSMALSYYKIKDDINDRTFSKKIAAYPLFAPHMKRITEKYGDKMKVIKDNLDRLSEYEKANVQNFDLTSDTFGKIMEEIFDFNKENSEVLRIFGYNIGKWLYTVDAIDDFDDDIKRGAFNPFASKQDIAAAAPAVWYNLSEAAKAYELLNLARNKDLLDNVVYLNLNATTERIFNKYEEK